MMKIALTGPLADRNLGDYAMFVNNIYDMGENNQYVIFNYSKGFVAELDNDYFGDYNCEYVEVKLSKSFYRKPKFIERVVKFALKSLNFKINPVDIVPTPIEIADAIENIDEIKKQLADVDVLLVSGGGYFNQLWYDWGRKDDLFKIVAPIIVAKMLGKQVVFSANGFGPFDESEKFYSEIFGFLDDTPIAVRDTVMSSTYLKKLGVDNAQLHKLPDDLYLLNDELSCKADNVSHFDKKYIVIEFYYPLSWLKEHFEAVKGFIERINKEHGLDVVYMPFDDNDVSDYLKEHIKFDFFHVFQSTGSYLKLEDAVSIIRNAEFVICNRYHALVISISHKVPVVNVMKPVYDLRYYFNKNYGLLKNALSGTSYDASTILRTDYLEVLEDIGSNLSHLKEAYRDFYQSQEFDLNKRTLGEKRKDYFKKYLTK
ncbi:polysaccharide pyruvyl transferase family protein [Pseudoalteromonas ardens]|uniref:Polysaccharide pyruvyl transferase domain-containing protein n=1 Tax=Pseudoalteromonas rubra TaxID=43658 RepID=A0A0L0EV45_9GAMM|nr:polysaccharide pyruvyl transferase family protein [Pseudoalteromonas sp. R96]KNC67738.1 hypothetical protein AC626_08845 [Pseudoalteromonas rubra]MDK1312547.1 polysaccharide pyruvyl transferase family protein [Pseudoalteromonas sp. R96]